MQSQGCHIKKVAIFGSADVDNTHPLYQEVFKISKKLAQIGKTIVNGGGPGVMDAATQGAKAGGGKTIVVTFYPKDMPEFEGRHETNQVDKEIKTANYTERLMGLISESDAFVIFRGGTGTLSEWTTVWLLSHLYFGKHKPIILYGEFWYEVIKVINDNFMIGKKEESIYKIVVNEYELEEALKEFEIELEKRC
jgi:uncharacterized protein (TIGR00730 family)